VSRHKPILLVKGGETDPAAPAAGDEVFEEACRCSGVVRVHRIADLFRTAELLTAYPTPPGRRLTILTNARGPGLLAADALRADGGRLAPLAPETVAELGQVLTARWNRQNPVDVGDDAGLERFAQAAAVAGRDPNTDALLVVLTPHATIDPRQAAERLRPVAGAKPVLACWLWGAADVASLAALQDAGIPTFHSPEDAARVFGYLWRHGENLRFLSELSTALAGGIEEDVNQRLAAQIIADVRASGRTVLTAAEHQLLFSAYSLPAIATRLAESEQEATEAAEALGYPVALDLASAQELLDREAEGIRLKAFDAAAVRRAFATLRIIAREYAREEPPFRVQIQPLVQRQGYEMALQSATHTELGPVLQFRPGGRLWTPAREHVVALPPLTPRKIRQVIEESSLFRSAADRGLLDVDALYRFLTRFSRLVAEQRGIKELTIDPLLVSPERVIALDARVILHEAGGVA
jgi:acetyltransferase